MPNAVTITTSLTISGLTANSFLYSGTAGLLTTTSAPTNGQLLIGSTGAAPALAALSGSASVTVTNGAGTITLSTSEPFYTTNTRAIISGTGNTNTSVSSTSGGGIFGGNTNTTVIGASSGSVAVGGYSSTMTLQGRGNVQVGGTANGVTSVVGDGNVIIGTSGLSGGTAVGSVGCAVVGGSSMAGSVSGTANVVIGSVSLNSAATVNGSGSVVIGSVFLIGGVNANGSAIIGSNSVAGTITGSGCVLIGSISYNNTLSGTGAVVVGGSGTGISVAGNGCVAIGGGSMGSSSIASGNTGTVIVGGSNSIYSATTTTGGVFIGGNVVTGSMSNSSGAVILGSSNSNFSITGSVGTCMMGGTQLATTITSGSGSAIIGGRGYTNALQGIGNVIISAAGTIGSSSNDSNFVLIGGNNTTLTGNSVTLGNPGSISIGPSTLTVIYAPNNPKLFLKDNHVSTKTKATYTGAGTLSAADVSGGVIQFTTASGAYVMPTTALLCAEMLDSASTAFTGSPNHVFEVMFYNTSGGACTIATGTGQTLTNGTSPISISNNASQTWKCWFTSPTAMLIEVYQIATGSAEPFFTSNSRAIIAGTSNTNTSVSSTSSGCVIGGSTNTNSIAASSGGVIIGGNSNNVTATGVGSVAMGGISDTITITGNGCVAINAGGTLGSVAGDSGNVLIGGSGTTVKATNNVVIGSSTVTQTFAPSTAQTFIKSNPIFAWTTNTPINNGGTAAVALTATQLINGYITRTAGTVAPNFTFPTAPSVYNAAVDNSAGPFGLNMVFYFLIQNITGTGAITLTTNTGWGTLQGTTGTIGAGTSRAGMCILISATTGVLFFFG